ncbi:RkpR, polysaccharide export protein [Ensifer adhaerens OV14]|nr:RkpR, polysaccharide export protein [Ensifer adhaerens OV14]
MTDLKQKSPKTNNGYLSTLKLPRQLNNFVQQRLTNVKAETVQLSPLDQKPVLSAANRIVTGGSGGKILLYSFLCFVIFPTLVALAYYSIIASDVYVVEAKITVRDGTYADGGSQTSSILSKFGITKGDNSAQSALIVLDYIRSRAIIHDIGGPSRLFSEYNTENIDWLSRIDPKGSIEDTWKYWRDRVTASVDTTSKVLTLRVRGYTPESAMVLSTEIIAKSEVLVNRISQRSREDSLARAEGEVARSLSDLADVRAQLLRFQQKTGSIDPLDSAKRLIALISSLTAQKVEIESRLSTATATGVAGRPGDRSLQSKLEVVNGQISELNDLLASKGGQNSISEQLKEYELLKLREEFAKQIYMISRGSYEQARRGVDRQQLYVATVVPPILPDSPSYPRMFIDSGLVMLACAVFWSITALIVASVRDSAV